MLYKYRNLLVRKILDKDKPLLVKWLSDQNVLKYYEGRDRPHDFQMVTEHFYNCDRNVMGCIVEYKNKEIGYIQFYPLDRDEAKEYGYSESINTIFGTDQFIGEVEYWNKGIGTLLVKSMVSYLIEKREATKIVMDPQAKNKRAIACYEKCGLKKVKLLPKHESHEGELRDCWLMEYSVK